MALFVSGPWDSREIFDGSSAEWDPAHITAAASRRTRLEFLPGLDTAPPENTSILQPMTYKLCVKGEADKLLSVRDVYAKDDGAAFIKASRMLGEQLIVHGKRMRGYQLWNGERLVRAVSLHP